jgi:hypothetical protein
VVLSNQTDSPFVPRSTRTYTHGNTYSHTNTYITYTYVWVLARHNNTIITGWKNGRAVKISSMAFVPRGHTRVLPVPCVLLYSGRNKFRSTYTRAYVYVYRTNTLRIPRSYSALKTDLHFYANPVFHYCLIPLISRIGDDAVSGSAVVKLKMCVLSKLTTCALVKRRSIENSAPRLRGHFFQVVPSIRFYIYVERISIYVR